MKWAKAVEAMMEGWRVSRPGGRELQREFGGFMARHPGGGWLTYDPTETDRRSLDWVVVGEKEY